MHQLRMPIRRLATLLTVLQIAFGLLVPAAEAAEISGKLLKADRTPFREGLLFFFDAQAPPPPAPDRYWRVPDLTMRVDQDGSFTTTLPEGSYFVAATPISSVGRPVSPPRTYLLVSYDETGKQVPVRISDAKPTDLGTVQLRPYSRVSRSEPPITAIAGTVTDDQGKPLTGALLFAYLSADLSGKPAFVADHIGTDGAFLLRVDQGRTFYLFVSPQRGEPQAGSSQTLIIGKERERPPNVITLQTGEQRNNVNLIVR